MQWMPDWQSEVKVICFNYYRGDELINIKFRSKGKTKPKDFYAPKDAEQIFYNINAIENEDTAVIVEGEIDCLSMYEAGIFNCVSVPNGASKGVQKLQYLDNCYQSFSGLKKIIIAVDNDTPGNLLKEELGRRLDKERCYLVQYPEGCKDANEVLIKHGNQGLLDLVANAKQWPIEGIIHVEELDEEVVEFYENGYPKGTSAHIDNFDNYCTFLPGQITTITGIPGHGKDEFTNLIMTGLAKFENWSFGICNFEEPPAVHVTKLQEKYTGKAFDFRRDPKHRINETEFIQSFAFLKKYFYYINMQMVGATIPAILEKGADLVNRYGIKGLLVNPWNCLEHLKAAGQSETDYVSECMTSLLNFGVKYGVHIFLVAHPTKMFKDEKTGKYKVPSLYNISGSAHFFNKTYNGLCVYRDYDTNIATVYIQKIKWYWLGKLGWVAFSYDTMIRQYMSISESHPEPKNYYETEKQIDF